MKPTHLAVFAATALAVAVCSTGCGNNDQDHSAHATSTTAVPTSSSTSTTADPASSSTAPSTPSAEIVEDVNCGPVTDAGGGTRTVIAVGGTAGRVGCTEAITVATKYVTTISNTDAQTVDGWQCNAQPDPATPSSCSKDGLVIALRAN
ncbi:hypothetical protein NONI108955_16540 [Nocardia ninae]|uniref:Lipoprotein n=1 Tax=Nocardia ninae NBRC 108245 TaxID=1210091 RepID=A0A511MFF1_9NOCA|nr:hypothetical protein [Nocardia ninae]GEM39384.1 hypothetical protein NN4_39030 [Nocardia ninae NBRC 108245]